MYFGYGFFDDNGIYDAEDTAGQGADRGSHVVVFSLFPSLADACAGMLGIYSTPNFLFLFMIFLLMVKVFGMTLQVSELESRQKELVQMLALSEKEREELEGRLLSLLKETEVDADVR